MLNDWLTKAGAEEMAAKVRGYWYARGVSVETRVEMVPAAKGQDIYVIRSNLVNGLPPLAKSAYRGGRT